MRANFLFILILVITLTFVGFLVKKKKQEISKIPPPKTYEIPVEYAKVENGEIREEFFFVGTVEPYEFGKVSTKLSGRVIKVYKREGDYFKKGEILVKIDDKELKRNISSLEKEKKAKETLIKGLEADLKSTEILLKNAQNEYEREKFLFENGAVPKVVLEKAENNLAQLRSKLENVKAKLREIKLSISALNEKIKGLKSQLQYTEIKAIKDGQVAKLFLHEGDLATPGKPIMEVFYPQDGLKILVNIPREDAKEIPVRSEVFLANSLERIGEVVKYYPFASSQNSLLVAEVKIKKNKEVRPFENVSLKILGKPYKGEVVPVYSLLHLKDGTYVLKVNEDGKVTPFKVKVLKTFKDKAVISSKLKQGDKVVVGRESKLLEVLRKGKAVLVDIAER